MVSTARRVYASVKIAQETWAALNAQRAAPGESLDSVIRRLLAIQRESATAQERT